MQTTDFLRGLTADDINGAFAALMREERDPTINLPSILDREARDYPMIAELIGSLGEEADANGGANTPVLERLHGMLVMARAVVLLAEGRTVHLTRRRGRHEYRQTEETGMNCQLNHNGNTIGDRPVPSPMAIEMMPVNDWDLWVASSGGNGDDDDPPEKPTFNAATPIEYEITDTLVGLFDEEHGGAASAVPGHDFFLQSEYAAEKRVLAKDADQVSGGNMRRRARL